MPPSPLSTTTSRCGTPNTYNGAWALYPPSGGYRGDRIDGSEYTAWGQSAPVPTTGFNFTVRHNDMGIAAYMDGHVKAQSYSSLYNGGVNTYFDLN